MKSRTFFFFTLQLFLSFVSYIWWYIEFYKGAQDVLDGMGSDGWNGDKQRQKQTKLYFFISRVTNEKSTIIVEHQTKEVGLICV